MNTYLNPAAIQDRSIEPIKLNSAIIEVTYAELKELRDNAQLIPGQQYRITDYVTSTTQMDTTSANHQFDIIVIADSESTLNEVARAIQHDGDTYFANSDLNAWEIWYCLDNDAEKFMWANESEEDEEVIIGTSLTPIMINSSGFVNDLITNDGQTFTFDKPVSHIIFTGNGATYTLWELQESTGVQLSQYPPVYIRANSSTSLIVYSSTNVSASYLDSYPIAVFTEEQTTRYAGKGVIYRMIDERGNDCPYDFKNIKFKHPKDATTYSDYYYTFTTLVSVDVSDHSLNNSYCYNNVIKEYNTLIVAGKFAGKYSNSLNKNVFINTTSTSRCHDNSFGDDCHSNSFVNECNNNSFGNGCYSNSFGNGCYSNSFGNECHDNSFVENCHSNSFGEGCYSNSFGNNCWSNTFGNGCANNPFGNGCDSNSFENGCYSNSFGNNCNYNSFENGCFNNKFGNGCDGNFFGNNCSGNSFGNNCNYNSFGNYCSKNSFRVGSSSTSNLRDHCNSNKFCDGCDSVILWNSTTASSTSCLQSVNVNLIWYTGSSPSSYYTAEIGILRSLRPINVYYNGYTLLAVDYGEKWRHITSSTTLTKDDKHIICDNTSAITITLPTGWNGAEYYIHKRSSTSYNVTVKTVSDQYISKGYSDINNEIRTQSDTLTSLGTSKLIWDPSVSEWIRIYMG